jgi:DMSO/TMAO reductase YedYZ molybdopterin-dependent catalytic subunit
MNRDGARDEKTGHNTYMVMSFFDRQREIVKEMGYDPNRLPPGQYITDRFPVLHVGDVPTYKEGEWSLKVGGLVDNEFVMTYDDLLAMPSITMTVDIHCVTKWSQFDMTWRGVRVRDILQRAGIQPNATHFMGHAEFGYTANLPLEDVMGDNAIVAYEYEGEPLEPIHGGPVRLVVPHLYFWKSPKWLRGMELRDSDEPGFWERNGYHMYGDPFQEQRFWGD